MNSLWQAAIVAALVWLALRFLPKFNIELNAATRYAIWWAALAVVLILPVAPAALRAMRSRPAAATVNAPQTARLAPVPDRPAEPIIITVTPKRTANWPLAIVAVWAGILLFRLGQIARSYIYLRGVKERAHVSPIPLPASSRRADLLVSCDIASPMAVGFARPAVILPGSLMGELSEPEREHVLLHEMAHLAGYDDWSNLAMRILGAALALHPVAIWILRRIEREREMVCDDWVVARTSDARPYAATLARLFELRWSRQNEALAPGLFGRGTRVGDRIEMLLRRGRTFSTRIPGGRAATSLLILGAMLLTCSLAPRLIAFAEQPSFEVASVKPGMRTAGDRTGVFFEVGGRFTVIDFPLKTIIETAYEIHDHQIAGAPGWLSTATFNIEAKAANEKAGAPELRPMIRSLLVERFKMASHFETREETIYELVVDKGGSKLTEATDSLKGRQQGIGGGRNGILYGMAAGMPLLASELSRQLGRSVIDKTGLTGKYDFRMHWTPENQTDENAPSSIFTAVQENLGLRLQAAKGPVEILVMDHVEKPDAN